MTPTLDPALAVDGIDEFLTNLPYSLGFVPGRVLSGTGETVHLHCTDAEGEWMITLSPSGFDWTHGHGKGTVAIRGTAGDLFLLLYRRVAPSPERFEIFGERSVLEGLLEKTSF